MKQVCTKPPTPPNSGCMKIAGFWDKISSPCLVVDLVLKSSHVEPGPDPKRQIWPLNPTAENGWNATAFHPGILKIQGIPLQRAHCKELVQSHYASAQQVRSHAFFPPEVYSFPKWNWWLPMVTDGFSEWQTGLKQWCFKNTYPLVN